MFCVYRDVAQIRSHSLNRLWRPHLQIIMLEFEPHGIADRRISTLAHAMCGPAALVHSTTDLLRSQTCNRVICIQPRGWIYSPPCRTRLSSTYISDNVYTTMEQIKNELRRTSILTEFLQRTITC